ncbi:beta-ketoacyl synthase N-terminal-like domain-containing protein [Planosporangium mesophilum]|uniref:Putative polyketide beta-ketoacyl synthase 2 n=1 Tax=Planosporangium mesophilum TaxID=689768 RepID=A0A8J3TE30_9ACTN|nr:beta-ketoacyl synthase N-terminal-like domain-containing protein [Planosporangium mesophilum]NJC84386.1 ketosynthase chain-length factor [Planosporangium mesophilum]GII23472.1 putative polyketide beta-ketoacyl synthase 2 [Planosporangium mesophilum]
MIHRRAVLTGLGVVAPTGGDTAEYWETTLAGRSAIGPITRYDASRHPVRLAGEVRAFDASGTVEQRILAQTDLWTHFALVAAQRALAAANLTTVGGNDFGIGVTTSSSSGGNAFGQREIQALWSKGSTFVGPYQSIAWFYAASTGQLSIAHQLRGPCGVICTEAAGGLDALAHARRVIRRGTRAVLTGGTEAPVSPYAVTCQVPAGTLFTGAEPARAYLPFARDAAGHVPGEGGAMMLLEEAESARDRGVPALAEVTGYAAAFTAPSFDRQDAGGWAPTAPALAAAIRGALADARLSPADIDAVVADAVGVQAADRAEVAALRAALGERATRIPVTAPKAGVGRLYSGGAALDAATAALAIRDGVLPPTPSVTVADLDEDIDLVTGSARRLALENVLVVARGFGGFASALVLSRVPDLASHL